MTKHYATTDHEYMILSEITANERISQRELSRTLGVSLGTVNILLHKMMKEGLIKMEQVSQKQVLYMLTPAGMMEKVHKTMNYLKVHYQAIDQMKERIKHVLRSVEAHGQTVYVLVSEDEIGEIIRLAIEEYQEEVVQGQVKYIYSMDAVKEEKGEILLINGIKEEMTCEMMLREGRIIDLWHAVS